MPRFSRIVRRTAARGSRARPSSEVETLDAVAMLIRQHRSIARRLERLAADAAHAAHTREAVLHRALLEVADALAIHIALGEREFYPALRAPSVTPRIAAHPGQRTVRARLAEILRVGHGPREFRAAVKALAEAFARHVADEERCVFPAARAALGPSLDAVGQEMMATMTALEEGVPCSDVLNVR